MQSESTTTPRGTGPRVSRHGAVQSHLVGPAIAEGSWRTTAYQACVALTCSACGRAIALRHGRYG